MFTGIIEHILPIQASEHKDGSLFLTLQGPADWNLRLGASVALDGVCTSVLTLDANGIFTVELMPETLTQTNFGKRVPPFVNAELPVRVGGRLDGHVVQGHADTIGRVENIAPRGRARTLSISFPLPFRSLLVPKGSVAVDGISLTVTDVKGSAFDLDLLDYTIHHTTLGQKNVGDLVNLEFDILAKYATHYGTNI